ncbi:MAG: hypothetical protein A2X77_00610 [Gammaproteobacteria bacterium GWE2_42_36]|nr:MAG: hypothetical protein A2X77_00610 [Gammaproteobacteria bacterium GWE2_42_36]HCU05343.1 hypothetical protein [Coxiellaceae bacterium]
MRKLLIAISLISALFCGVSYGAAPAVSVGIVDVQQILQQSPKVNAASEKLRKEFSPQQNELKSSQDQMQQLIDKLNRNGAVMQAKDKADLQAQIDKIQQDLTQKSQTFQQNVMNAQQKEMQDLLAQITTVVKGVAEKHNITLVIDKSAVVYSVDGLDMTAEVQKAFS